MKRALLTIALLALIAASAAGIASAQGELTLESLALRLESLGERVENLEALYADPWSPGVLYTDDGICQNPLHLKGRYSSAIGGEIHQETADSYRKTYGVSIDPSDVYLQSISFGVGSNHVYFGYGIGDKIVVERWAHCDFLGHSEWAEE